MPWLRSFFLVQAVACRYSILVCFWIINLLITLYTCRLVVVVHSITSQIIPLYLLIPSSMSFFFLVFFYVFVLGHFPVTIVASGSFVMNSDLFINLILGSCVHFRFIVILFFISLISLCSMFFLQFSISFLLSTCTYLVTIQWETNSQTKYSSKVRSNYTDSDIDCSRVCILSFPCFVL